MRVIFLVIFVLGFWTPRTLAANTVLHYIAEPTRDSTGKEKTFTSANGFAFTAAGDSSGVSVVVSGTHADGTPETCRFDFGPAPGSVLEVGTFLRATSWDDPADRKFPKLRFSSNDVSGFSQTGHFQVLEMTFDTAGNLVAFAADFLLHDFKSPTACYGELRVNSAVPYASPAGFAELPADNRLVHSADGATTVHVSRRVVSRGPLAVDYATVDGSAQAGKAYRAVHGTLVWTDGDTSERIITVPLLNPDTGQPGTSGSFFLDLTGPGAGQQRQMTISVINVNPAVTLFHEMTEYEGAPGSGGEETTSLANRFTITPSRNDYGGVSFSMVSAPDAHGDTASRSLEFLYHPGSTMYAGDYPVRYVKPTSPSDNPWGPAISYGGITALTGDILVREAEYDPVDGSVLRFAADFVQNAESIYPFNVYGQIRYNSAVPLPPPQPTTVRVEVRNPVISDNGPFAGYFEIIRTGSLARSLTVHYRMVGTAVNGRDYYLLKGKKKIRAGETSAELELDPYDVYKGEFGGRRVRAKMKLLPGNGYTLATPRTGKISIYQDYSD